jgi:hypothetical protein
MTRLPFGCVSGVCELRHYDQLAVLSVGHERQWWGGHDVGDGG